MEKSSHSVAGKRSASRKRSGLSSQSSRDSELDGARQAAFRGTNDYRDRLSEKSSAKSVNKTASDLSSLSSANDDTDQEVRSQPEEWKSQSQEGFLGSFDAPQRQRSDDRTSEDHSETNRRPSSGHLSSSSSRPSVPSSLESLDENLQISPEELQYISGARDRMFAEMERDKSSPYRQLSSVESNMMSGMDYLERTLGQVLARGLSEIIKRSPSNPVEFLAAYLLADQARLDMVEKRRSQGEVSGEDSPDDDDEQPGSTKPGNTEMNQNTAGAPGEKDRLQVLTPAVSARSVGKLPK